MEEESDRDCYGIYKSDAVALFQNPMLLVSTILTLGVILIKGRLFRRPAF